MTLHDRCSPRGLTGVLGLLVLLGGCSKHDEVGLVHGKVTLGGQPLTQGSGLIENRTKGISLLAPLSADGTYTARTYEQNGLPPGTYQVAITPNVAAETDAPLVQQPTPEGKTEGAIPAKYRRVATSGLSVTVQAGDNPPFDFNLTP